MKNKTLVIIAGAAGEIGTAFCKQVSFKDIECLAIVRNKPITTTSPLITTITCSLDDVDDIEVKFSHINFEDYKEVIYLHTIGVDKFDPRGYPHVQTMKTIDEDVYNTNVNSFKYLMRYLVKNIRTINESKKEKIQLKLAIIAGVADKHAPFVIESFCEVKYILRQYIQSQVGLYPDWVSGLSINVTSTITKSALAVRPHADTTFWLTPEEVATQSIKDFISNEKGYKEIDIIKNLPSFIEDYYENNEMLYKKWSSETGIK